MVPNGNCTVGAQDDSISATQGTIEEWHVVFCISAAFCAVGMIVYFAFASDEIQPWAKTEATVQNKSSTAIEENTLLAVASDEGGEKARTEVA